MIIYNVTITLDPSIEEDWLRWMKAVHVPDVMNTGMFVSNRILRVLDERETGPSFAIQYECKDLDTLSNYQDKFAKALQKEHTERYQGKFAAFRTLLEIIE